MTQPVLRLFLNRKVDEDFTRDVSYAKANRRRTKRSASRSMKIKLLVAFPCAAGLATAGVAMTSNATSTGPFPWGICQAQFGFDVVTPSTQVSGNGSVAGACASSAADPASALPPALS